MVFRDFFHVMFNDLYGHVRIILFPLNLKQQTFLKISGTYARRIQFLNILQQFFNLLFRNIKMICNLRKFPGKITTGIQRTDQIFHDHTLQFGIICQQNLCMQIFLQIFLGLSAVMPVCFHIFRIALLLIIYTILQVCRLQPVQLPLKIFLLHIRF